MGMSFYFHYFAYTQTHTHTYIHLFVATFDSFDCYPTSFRAYVIIQSSLRHQRKFIPRNAEARLRALIDNVTTNLAPKLSCAARNGKLYVTILMTR